MLVKSQVRPRARMAPAVGRGAVNPGNEAEVALSLAVHSPGRSNPNVRFTPAARSGRDGADQLLADLARGEVHRPCQPGGEAAVALVARDEELAALVVLELARLADQGQALGVLAVLADHVAHGLGLEADDRPVAVVVLLGRSGIVGRVVLGRKAQAAPAVQAQVAAELAVTVEG